MNTAIKELKRLLRKFGERPGAAVMCSIMSARAAARAEFRKEIRSRIRHLEAKSKTSKKTLPII